MARLALGTCRSCGHPVGMHSKQGKWLHHYHDLGPYILSLDCKFREKFTQSFGTCTCTTPEPDPSKPTKSHFSL